MPKISVIDLFKRILKAIFLLLKITGGLILLFLIIFSIRIFTHQLGYKPPEGSNQQVPQQNHTQSPGILLTQPTNPENSVQVNFDGLLMRIPETADVLARIKSEKTPQPVAVDGIARDFMFPEMRQTTCAFNPYLPRTKEHFPVCVTSSFRITDPGHQPALSIPTPGRIRANNIRQALSPSSLVNVAGRDLNAWDKNRDSQKFDYRIFEATARDYGARDNSSYEASITCLDDCRGYVYIKELAIQYFFYVPLVAEERLDEVIQATNSMFASWAQTKLSRHVAPIQYFDLVPVLTRSEPISLTQPVLPKHALLFTTKSDVNPEGVQLLIPSSEAKIQKYVTTKRESPPYTCCIGELVYWYPQMILSDEDAPALNRDRQLIHPNHFKVLISDLWGYSPQNDDRPHRDTPKQLMPFIHYSSAATPDLRETKFSNLWRWYPDREYQEKRKGILDAKDQYFASKDTAPYEAYIYCPSESGRYCEGEVYIKDIHIQYHFFMQSEGRESLGNVIDATNAMIRGWAHS